MLIGFPLALFASTVLSGPGTTTSRTAASNKNFLPYTFTTTTQRVHNIRSKRTMGENAAWSQLRFKDANWTCNNTSESITYPTQVIKRSIAVGATQYPATWSGASEKVLAPGSEAETDNISGLASVAAGTEVEVCTRIVLPLLFDAQTANFTVGEVVTGGTSGATGTVAAQTDNGSTGSLVLTGESGTWVDNELVTGNLGGSATVDLATSQNLLISVGTQAIWNEGIKSGQDTSTDHTTTQPVVYPVYTANVSGGNITSVTKVSGGSGWTVAPNLLAWEIQADGTIAIKTIGYGNLSAGTVNSGSVTSGTPPTGVAAWVTPNVMFAAGSGYGAATAIVDAGLLTGIPSVPVRTLKIKGDSIRRGYSSTDGIGDIRHNFGISERAIYNRYPTVNFSTSGAAAGNEIQFGTIFARSYAFYQGTTTHTEITIGSNDLAASVSESTLRTNINTLAAKFRADGDRVAVSRLLPRGKTQNITGITQAASAVVTVNNTCSIGDEVYFGTTSAGVQIGGMTQIRGLIGTVTAATSTTITVNINSSGFGAYTSGGGITVLTPAASQVPETGFAASGAADTYNTNVGNGTIVQDWTPPDGRALFQDNAVATAWEDTAGLITLDTIHPSGVGLVRAKTNTTHYNAYGVLA